MAVADIEGPCTPLCPSLTANPGVSRSFPVFQEGSGAWAGAQLGPPQNVVVHFGVGSSSVFLAQMQPKLTLVPEMQTAGVALSEDS